MIRHLIYVFFSFFRKYYSRISEGVIRRDGWVYSNVLSYKYSVHSCVVNCVFKCDRNTVVCVYHSSHGQSLARYCLILLYRCSDVSCGNVDVLCSFNSESNDKTYLVQNIVRMYRT